MAKVTWKQMALMMATKRVVYGAVTSAIAFGWLLAVATVAEVAIVGMSAAVVAIVGLRSLQVLSAADAPVPALAATTAATVETATAKVSGHHHMPRLIVGHRHCRRCRHYLLRCLRMQPNATGRAAASKGPNPLSPLYVCAVLRQLRHQNLQQQWHSRQQ